ncbi:MAG: replicative helicase loader/inhibitor [Bacillota bacterium]|nr:replicative helicase loader/inhibitor [Bacillota bacterium]
MTKRETYSLMSTIRSYYDQFEVDQEKVDVWYEALKNYEFEDLKRNLLSFVSKFPYPPKVSDLVPKAISWNSIPNLEETRQIIYPKVKLASEETVRRETAKIDKILGIVRDQHGRIRTV